MTNTKFDILTFLFTSQRSDSESEKNKPLLNEQV